MTFLGSLIFCLFLKPGVARKVILNFYRKFQQRNAKRCSGGVAVYFKSELKSGIEIVRSHFDTIIWLRLDSTFFSLDCDVYIGGVYIWCEDSPAYNVVNTNLMEILESDINDFQALGIPFTIGDFNSRVGRRDDYIHCDNIATDLDYDGYAPDTPLQRNTLDKQTNSMGLRLIDLCKSTEIAHL